MYEGYATFGCNEILNRARAYGYSRSADCPVSWLKLLDCETEPGGYLSADQYDYGLIQDAPWYDAEIPASGDFFGAYPILMENLSDSTIQASITEGILDGGVVSGYRNAVRTVRIRAFLIGRGREALEYGKSWLESALRLEQCGAHGPSCGEVDFQFFVDCPPPNPDPDNIDEDTYEKDYVDPLARMLHGVSRVSGPNVVETFRRDDVHAYLVEFVVAANSPFVYSLPRVMDTPPVVPETVQDVVRNLVPYPSAELPGDPVVVATNYSTNPSVETDATDWAGTVATISGSNPASYFTTGRSTDISAAGDASFRGRILGNGVTAVSGSARIQLYQDINLALVLANARVSVTIWGAAIILGGAGASNIDSLTARIDWYNNTATLIDTTPLGAADPAEYDGRVFSVQSEEIPATAVAARIIVQAEVDWGSSGTPSNNSDIRIYADALALTVP